MDVLHFDEIFLMYLFIFRQRGMEGEREGEKHQCVVASHMPLLGTWPATQPCALTGNGTDDPLVPRPVLSPLSHTSQGHTMEYYSDLKTNESLICYNVDERRRHYAK